MAQTTQVLHDAHGHEVEVHETRHIVPISVYLTIFSALMVLLFLTVAAARLDLGPLNVVVALTIAVIKAVLIALFFMHLRYNSRITWVFAGAALVWLSIMFCLTFSDYQSRSWLPAPKSWTASPQQVDKNSGNSNYNY